MTFFCGKEVSSQLWLTADAIWMGKRIKEAERKSEKRTQDCGLPGELALKRAG